ncbi:hypothetical protein B5E84_17615 [Lachnoclostridium sp. An14]|uniref:immunoglobulin-like domain-containing protein n=1 Tax=Lachnoclostridium sp. An14 TaxID=1965562 RepID=UPI000B392152|nr:immunoglobulin-like domain-containing protein [Lachnoclostridium sp. An14]OUQ13310.1 hypothetical protein B5E84_17615 [Lachnoclostridium sp. An14]
MKRQWMINGALFAGVVAGVLFLEALFGLADPVERNSRALAASMKALKDGESGTKISLEEVVPFSWEEVYSFDPYVSVEEMKGVLGTGGKHLTEAISEGQVQLVFLEQGEVTASVCGYGEDLGYDIDLGLWEDGKRYRRVSAGVNEFTLYTDGEYPRLVFEGERFLGTILERWESSALVAVDEGFPIRASGDQVYISLAEEQEAEPGDRVEVFYDGWVQETFPLQLGGQMRVRLNPPEAGELPEPSGPSEASEMADSPETGPFHAVGTAGEEEPARTPTGYDSGEVQRISIYYGGTLYLYEAAGFDLPLEEGFQLVGTVEESSDREYLFRELCGTRLEPGQEVYAHPEQRDRVYVKFDRGFGRFLADEGRSTVLAEGLPGLAMEVSQVGAGAVTVEIRNDSAFPCLYGEPYQLEQKRGEGWYVLPYVMDGNVGFHSIGYEIQEGESASWTAEFAWLYGELEPGVYRIVKELSILQEDGTWLDGIFAAEFSVTA